MVGNPAAPDASPGGIAECLRMLADEAASLRLVRTLMALLETAEICQIEASAIAPQPEPALLGGTDPPLQTVH